MTSTNPQPFEPRLPGSKSYTNRALILAAQRPGTTEIIGALHSDDTRYLAAALDAFGGLEVSETAEGFRVVREPGRLRAPAREVYLGAAGTPARFLLAFAALAEGATTITGNARLSERPMGELLAALETLGIRSECLARPGCLPVRIHGGTPRGRKWKVNAAVSSQFVSALLLLAAAQEEGPITITVAGQLASRPYVEMTLGMMHRCGISCEERGESFTVHPSVPSSAVIPVEPDASAASYFLVAAAITGTRVCIRGLGSGSAQGDVGLARALERMGCGLAMSDDTIELEGRPLRGITLDMEKMPDVVLSLAIAAARAEGPTRIENVANLRVKESDRLHAAAVELERVGIRTEEGADFLVIHPASELRPARIHTYDDHRVAMAFGLLRLLNPGIELEDPSCVAKSFPTFWEELARFGRHHEG